MESVKTKMEQEFGGTIMSFVVSYGKDTKIIKNRERKRRNEKVSGNCFVCRPVSGMLHGL